MAGLHLILALLALACFGQAGPTGSPPEDSPPTVQTVTLTGTFVVLYADPETRYYVVDDLDRSVRTHVVVDESVARLAGGVPALQGRRVTVTGFIRPDLSQGTASVVEAQSITPDP